MFFVEALLRAKKASTSSRSECEDIMSRIYGEDPGKWPYGLDIDGHDGGVWLVRDSDSLKAAGFVGWQERTEKKPRGQVKVGYYTIGILPEFRGNGLARAAVSQLLQTKSASVDEVRAFIVPGNSQSEALARSLNIPIVRDA